jgi:hypothetical protein
MLKDEIEINQSKKITKKYQKSTHVNFWNS